MLVALAGHSNVHSVEGRFGVHDPCAFWVDLPWCKGHVRWKFSFSKACPEVLPDVLMHDWDFRPLNMVRNRIFIRMQSFKINFVNLAGCVIGCRCTAPS